MLGGEALRQDTESQVVVLTGILLLILLRLYLPDGDLSWRRRASQFIASVLLITGGYSLIQGSHSLYDLWASTWLILPAAASLYWVSAGVSGTWSAGDADQHVAQVGLTRNKQLGPALETFALHTFLIHAIALIAGPVIWIFDVSVSPGNIPRWPHLRCILTRALRRDARR